MALYQSQQVYIIQAGARRWAQIFAQAGILGGSVGEDRRVTMQRAQRIRVNALPPASTVTRSSRKLQQAHQTRG